LKQWISIVLVIAFVLASFVRAEPPVAARTSLWLPAVLGDHMVVQQGRPIAIWGRASAGVSVDASVDGGPNVSTVASDAGLFRIELPAMNAGGPHQIRVASAGQERIITDVLVGEVWLASGQSNMEWQIQKSSTPKVFIAEAQDRPNIRLFNVSARKKPATEPQEDVEATWQVCSSESVPTFSAVAYHFGVKLQTELKDVPVGLINASWGGMPAEAFAPVEKLQFEAMKPTLANWESNLARFDEAQAKYQADLLAWEALDEASRKVTTKPALPPGPMSPNRPGNLWNGMIHPLVPFGVRGFIWYQGESNAGRAAQYAPLLSAMIGAWREAWNAPDAPFLIVQLANFQAPTTNPARPSNWADLRAAQATVADEPGNGMAVIIDIGEEKDIHPRNKHDVGRRLALLALRNSYGQSDLVAEGPTPKSWKVEGNQIVISFDHVGSGLVAKDGKLESFAIASESGEWVWADAAIVGDTVVVSSPGVPTPARVRYAWADNPKATLLNKEGLPAGPFDLR
jgi:sialate O-acetylesterase